MATKTDNAHLEDKLKLRRMYLDQLKPGFSVIDCCAGSGHIWNQLRQEYECQYWGIDVKPKPGRLAAKSERVCYVALSLKLQGEHHATDL